MFGKLYNNRCGSHVAVRAAVGASSATMWVKVEEYTIYYIFSRKSLSRTLYSFSAACAAASLATGNLNGEQLT